MTAPNENPDWVKEALFYMMDKKKRFYPIGYENYVGKDFRSCFNIVLRIELGKMRLASKFQSITIKTFYRIASSMYFFVIFIQYY